MQSTTNIFTGIKAPRKLRFMLVEAKGINNFRRNYFKVPKKLDKLEPMYLEFILKEAKFNLFVKNQKAKKH